MDLLEVAAAAPERGDDGRRHLRFEDGLRTPAAPPDVDQVDAAAVGVVEVRPGQPAKPIQPVAVAGPHERPVRRRGEAFDPPGEPFGGRIVAETADSLAVARSMRPLARRADFAETQAPDLLIIDTPGIGPRDHELAQQLPLLTQIPGLCTLLCLQASTHPLESRRILRRYSSAQPAGLILTKLDETHLWGPALSLVVEQELPLFWVTDGQRVPQDLHRWNAATVIGHAVAAATTDDQDGQDTEVRNACA